MAGTGELGDNHRIPGSGQHGADAVGAGEWTYATDDLFRVQGREGDKSLGVSVSGDRDWWRHRQLKRISCGE